MMSKVVHVNFITSFKSLAINQMNVWSVSILEASYFEKVLRYLHVIQFLALLSVLSSTVSIHDA